MTKLSEEDELPGDILSGSWRRMLEAVLGVGRPMVSEGVSMMVGS